MPTASIELSIFLLVAGLVVLALELFLPSAGMLFVLALGLVISSVVVAFMVDTSLGAAMVLIDVILAFILPSVGIRIWKRTPIGKRMFLDSPEPDGDADHHDANFGSLRASDGFDYHTLMGETGRTITPLRPSGTTDFRGRRVDTVSEGVMIDRGELVRVVAVEGRRVVVRRVEDRLEDSLLQ